MLHKLYFNILGIIASVAVSGFIIGLRHQGSFEQIELLAYDSLVRLNAQSGFDERITIVGIDDNTLRKLNSDKVSDGTLKQVLETIRQYEPRVIGVDIIRDVPIGKGRKELLNYVNSIYQTLGGAIKPIIFPCALPSDNRPNGIASPPVIDPDSAIGFVDLETDPQNIFGGELIRRAYISSIPVDIGLETAPESQFDAESTNNMCTAPFSFSFLTALSYLQAQQIATLSPDATPELSEFLDYKKIEEGELGVKSLTFRPLKAKTGSYHNLDPSFYQYLIDYRYTQPGEIISLTKVLDNQVTSQQLKDKFKDKVVLIGYTTKEDLHQTPLGMKPGVLVHGWMVGQLLRNVLDRLPQIWTWSEPVEWLWILGWGVVGCILALGIRPVWIFIGVQGIAIAVLCGSCWFLFTQQGWIPLIPPVFSLAISSVVVKAIASKFKISPEPPPIISPPIKPPSDQTIDESKLVKPPSDQTIDESKLVKSLSDQTIDESKLVKPLSDQTIDESKLVKPPSDQTIDESKLPQSPLKPPVKKDTFVRDSFIGKSIGDDDRYLLHKLLGEGGMSKVYIALDKRLNNMEVAIKIMTSYFSANDQYLIRRFKTEVEDLCILTHPNIIKITDYGLTPTKTPFKGEPFFVMEYFVGPTLQQLLDKNKTLEPHLALRIILKVCHGLKAAHQKGIVHRDIKPANIFLPGETDTLGEEVKIIDFGIAKKIDEESKKHTQLTVAGTFLGTYRYASPEQCSPVLSVDSRTDIYSLGMVLYETLSGNNPYNLKDDSNTTNADWEVAHRRKTPIPLREQFGCQNIPVELEKIVMKCLAKSPQNRFQNIEELEQALRDYL
ncbi:MAG: CHASE2 domain-containing protein [Xenococcaceae cyanobacterium MO_188.B29]|nr:CHASE2 domain-containing protein [Xenococcaceae cyanobacterium MO_188.B29]